MPPLLGFELAIAKDLPMFGVSVIEVSDWKSKVLDAGVGGFIRYVPITCHIFVVRRHVPSYLNPAAKSRMELNTSH